MIKKVRLCTIDNARILGGRAAPPDLPALPGGACRPPDPPCFSGGRGRRARPGRPMWPRKDPGPHTATIFFRESPKRVTKKK